MLTTGTATGNTINPYSIYGNRDQRYMTLDGISVSYSTTQTKIWNFSSLTGTTTISTVIGGTTYYLGAEDYTRTNRVALKTTSTNWTWNISGSTRKLSLAGVTNSSYYRLLGFSNASGYYWYLSNNSGYSYGELTIAGTSEYSFTTTISKTSYSGSIAGPDEHINDSRTTTKMSYAGNDVTYFPLSTVNNTSNFNPSENNTAYVTAGYNIPKNAQPGDFTSAYTNVRFSKAYDIQGNISNDFTASSGTFTNIYTVNDSMARESIINKTSDYNRLSAAMESLGNVLKTSNNSDGKTYGVHFMDAAISMDAITTASYVSINNVPKTNYELPVNAIDFNLKEFGYVNFIAGTYFDSTAEGRNNSFFALYQIERLDSTPNKINRILEIKNVYQHKDKTKTYSYVYELTDGTNTFYTKPYKVTNSEGGREFLDGSTYSKNTYVNTKPADYTIKVFNTDRIKKNNISSTQFDDHVFYFEIPMNDGEFCLGSVSGGVGAYLMYLDIGANAAKTQRTIFYEKFSVTQKIFYYPAGVSLGTLPSSTTSGTATIDVSAVIDASDSTCMVIKTASKGTFKMDRNGSDVTLIRAQASNAPPVYSGGTITLVHENNSSTNIEPVPTTSSTKDIVRMQYYDYMINSDTLVVTTFTDTSTDGGSTYSRVVEQSKYSGHLVNPDNLVVSYISSTSGDVDKMKIYRSDTGVKYSSAEITSTSGLPISSSRLSNTVILKIDMLLDNVSGYTDIITLNAIVDTTFGTDMYYTFGSYSIVITPESGTITIKVIDYAGNITISVINVGNNNAASSKTATNTEDINGTGITGNGQTITIEYQAPSNSNP